MPKFEKRFARQHIYEPPPEFPLASPYSGIVHHLSGRNSNALTRIPPRRGNGSVDGAPRERLSPRRATSPAFTFIAHPHGFERPNTRATVALLGPCFKTGRMPPTSSQAARAQGVDDLPPERLACSGHCTQWHGATVERTKAPLPSKRPALLGWKCHRSPRRASDAPHGRL